MLEFETAMLKRLTERFFEKVQGGKRCHVTGEIGEKIATEIAKSADRSSHRGPRRLRQAETRSRQRL